MLYEEKKFDLPDLEGLSKESVEAHLGLYAGYVKNFNDMTLLVGEYLKDAEKHAHAISELIRRRSFEFGGMRLHEYYFAQWEGTSTPLSVNGPLATALVEGFGSVETAVMHIKKVGMMRGPGWSILYYDPAAKPARPDGRSGGLFQIGFTGEQHQGHFVTLPIILALDVWEHAYLLDYGTTGKAKYIDACFANYNWAVMEKRFEDALH
ncbi:MAG: Fe-Mn family superoxide dismutase [bacterium]|nr:Fe-Mn family superoxide dismutase [bacterium]